MNLDYALKKAGWPGPAKSEAAMGLFSQKHREKRIKVRTVDANKIGLMIAELEDMMPRHLSAYFHIKCKDAIAQLKLAESRLLELAETDAENERR